jgi:hypothetical protein
VNLGEEVLPNREWGDAEWKGRARRHEAEKGAR